MTTLSETDIRELIGKLDKLDKKIDDRINNLDQKLDGKLDKLDQKIDGRINNLDQKLDSKLDKLDQKLDKVVNRVEVLEVGQARTEEKLGAIDKRLGGVEQRLDKIEEKTEKQDNRYYTLLISLIGFLTSAFIAVLIGLGKVLFFTPQP